MDFVRRFFGTNETLTSWTLLAHFFSKSVLIQCWFSSDLEKNKPKVCNWSEFHLNRSYFLQNPYFKRPGWRLNHSFYRKFGFNEFVANILRDNMGSKKISLQPQKERKKAVFSKKIFSNWDFDLEIYHLRKKVFILTSKM